MLRSAVRLASSLLAPPRCGICAGPCSPAAPACPACSDALGRGPAGSGQAGGVPAVWAAPYAGVARALVTSLKFRARPALAVPAAAAIAGALGERGVAIPAGTVVVPVPASPLRLRARGFDAAELIAAALSERLDLGFSRCLVRGHGRRQVGRSRGARLADPPRVVARAAVPRRALVVDDVLTTGATLAACAAALGRAGCREVSAAVLARSVGGAPAGA